MSIYSKDDTTKTLSHLGQKKELIIIFLLVIIVLGCYFPFLVQNLTLDSVDYLEKVMYGSDKELFHPHHLIYNLLGRWIYQAWILVGWKGGGVLPAVSLNMVLGAGGIVLFFLICRDLFKDYRIALSCSFSLAFSYGYWFYSLVAEPHLPSIFILLLASYLLLRKGESKNEQWSLYLGITHGLAVLLHQSVIVFLPVVMIGIYQKAMLKPYRYKIKLGFIYLTGLSFVAGIPYISIAWFLDKLNSPGDFIDWLTYYHSQYAQSFGKSNNFHWGEFRADNIWQAASYGLGRAVIFGTPIREIVIQKMFYLKGLFLALGCLLVILIISFSCGYIITHFRLLGKKFRGSILLFLTWLASFGAFLVYWSPKAVELAIPLLVPLWVLVYLPYSFSRGTEIGLIRVKKPCIILSIILPLSLFITNLWGEIFPHSRPLNNETYNLSESIHNAISPGDLILMPLAPISLITPNFFTDNKIKVISLSSLPEMSTEKEKRLAISEIRQQIEQTIQNHHDVFLAEHELHPIRLGHFNFTHYRRLYHIYVPYLEQVFAYRLFVRRYWMYKIRFKK